jgi:hypothetical protein
LEDLDVDGRVILKLIFKKLDGMVDVVNQAQNRDAHHALVRAVMKLTVA